MNRNNDVERGPSVDFQTIVQCGSGREREEAIGELDEIQGDFRVLNLHR